MSSNACETKMCWSEAVRTDSGSGQRLMACRSRGPCVSLHLGPQQLEVCRSASAKPPGKPMAREFTGESGGKRGGSGNRLERHQTGPCCGAGDKEGREVGKSRAQHVLGKLVPS